MDGIFGSQKIALYLFWFGGERSAWHDQVVHFPLGKTGTLLFERDEGKRESGDMIAVLEKAAQIVEARNLGRQNKRFSLPVERKIAPGAGTVVVGLAQPLDLDFADGLTDPFRRPRLGGAEENLRGRLRQHGFGVFAVAGLHLAAPLKAQE